MRKNFNGFTLVELLVVVSIIIVLIGLTSAGVFAAIKKAKVQRAQTEVMNLLSAVKMYRSDIGFYPNGIAEKYIGQALNKYYVYGTAGTSASDAAVFGPYYEFKDSNSKTGTTATGRIPLDPWGNEYCFFQPNQISCTLSDGISYTLPAGNAQSVSTNGFAIVLSRGPDKDASKTDDDIGTWQ